MYNFKHNNYHLRPKNSTIYTPPEVSQFIFELLKDKIKKSQGTVGKPLILDPCCGQGSLLWPWQAPTGWIDNKKYSLPKYQYLTYGIDIDQASKADLKTDFLEIKNWQNLALKELSLVLCNPPFNGRYPQLAPEVWLDKIIELFGKDIPIVLFVPAGFTLNLTLESKRYLKFEQGIYPPISSRISLPKNIFKPVIFHSEILIFNIPNLEPHYFYKNHKQEKIC